VVKGLPQVCCTPCVIGIGLIMTDSVGLAPAS
jgi:hypothetical protein